MAAMNARTDDETLLQRMSRLNPWWKTGSVQASLLKDFRRRDYSTMVQHMDEPLAQSVLGARQVGKSTMLYRLIADLLSSGTDPRRILLLTLDVPGIAPNSEGLLRMLELYASSVIREPISGLTGRVHVVLDEVHLAKGWQAVVKNFFDQGWPVKFVISGSSAAGIFAGSPESLVGRIRHQTLAPMSFAEYAAFRNPSYSEALSTAGEEMRAGLDESVRTGRAQPFHESAKRASLCLAAAKDGIVAHLEEYMRYGGYPRIAAHSDPLEKVNTIKAYLDLSLYKDAAVASSVRRPALLGQLFRYYAWRSPRMISRDGVSRSLGIGKETVGAYSEILKWAFLVSYADFYTPRPSMRHRKDRKVYVNDVGVRNAASLLADTDPIDDPAEAGMMAETVAGDHTRRLWQRLAPASASPTPHYWHGGGGAEVDMVVRLRRRPVPIAVKYRRHVEASGLRGLSRFSDKFDSPLAIAVSRNESRLVGDGIVAVPMWLYLCMC